MTNRSGGMPAAKILPVASRISCLTPASGFPGWSRIWITEERSNSSSSCWTRPQQGTRSSRVRSSPSQLEGIAVMAHNDHGDLLVASGLPPFESLARAGNTWSVATATAFPPVVTKPLTVAPLEIVNNSGDQYMTINHIWSWQLLGTAVVWAHTIWAQVGAAVY